MSRHAQHHGISGVYAPKYCTCFSPPLCVTYQDLFFQPQSIPRAYKDDQGRKQQPRLRDLPDGLHGSFRNLFIHRVIERVCLSDKPWNNLTLPSLQREFGHAYPTSRARLHSDDAAVIPVSFGHALYQDQFSYVV